MAEPRYIHLSLRAGLLLVYVGYVVISNGLRVLFSPSYVFDGDALRAMPPGHASSDLVRLLMTLVLSVTAPLIVIPFGELVEGKIWTATPDDNDDDDDDGKQRRRSSMRRVFVRVPFCLACMAVSEFVPDGFVHLVSFIGCFCGGTTGLVLPPLFCLRLSRGGGTGRKNVTTPRRGGDTDRTAFLCDVVALCLGIAATSVTSFMTFRVLMGRVAV
jgi:hypothetical protein